MNVNDAGPTLTVTTDHLRVVVDRTQGGNITLATLMPADVPILTTNYHSTDVYIRLDDVGGFYTTGDTNGRVDIEARDDQKMTIRAESLLAPRPENPPRPESAGTVVRRYTLWHDLPLIRFDTEIRVDPDLPPWRSTDARLVDMEASHIELSRFAYPGPDGNTVSGVLDQARNGETAKLSAPWYTLFGDRVGLTVRVDDPTKYCFYWTENARVNIPRLDLDGIAWLAQWGLGEHVIGPESMPLRGIFWVLLHEAPGPKDFPRR